MARKNLIQVRRGTKAALDALAPDDQPLIGELCFTTDEGILYVGVNSTTPPQPASSMVPDATTLVAGKTQLATSAEIAAGTANKSITAAALYNRGKINIGGAIVITDDTGRAVFGYNSTSTDFGSSVFGPYARSSSSGCAFGYNSNGDNNGCSFGAYSNGSALGVSFGASSNGSSAGASFGSYSNGSNTGAAFGSAANGSNGGCAFGYGASSPNGGVAVGFMASASRGSVSIGTSCQSQGILNRIEIAPLTDQSALGARLSGQGSDRSWSFTAPMTDVTPTTAPDALGNANGTLPIGHLRFSVNAAGTNLVVHYNVAGTIKSGTIALA